MPNIMMDQNCLPTFQKNIYSTTAVCGMHFYQHRSKKYKYSPKNSHNKFLYTLRFYQAFIRFIQIGWRPSRKWLLWPKLFKWRKKSL